MPDEVVFTSGARSTPPAGTKIATDTVAGKEIQFVKLDIGGDGLSSPVVGVLPVYDVSGTSVNVSLTGSSVGIIKTALTPLAPTGTVVGLSSILVVSANVNRKGLTFVNASNSWISFGLGTAASLYAGITIAPNGGAFVMDEYTFCLSAIYGIASVTGTILAIQEFI